MIAQRAIGWCAGAVACSLALPLATLPAHAVTAVASPIAFPMFDATPDPRLLFAQRTITRQWGLSADSVYVVMAVPDWRSEGGAMTMSAALPGAGQLYVGERSGLLFLLAEAAGWAAHAFLRSTADDRRHDAEGYVGDPGNPASVWSFDRWADATQEDPAELQQIFAGDAEAFYGVIRDPRYAAGFVGEESRVLYETLQNSADRRRRYARYAVMGLWLNHAISAFDALRAARIHNLPLRRNLELRIRPSLGDDGAGLTASLEGSF